MWVRKEREGARPSFHEGRRRASGIIFPPQREHLKGGCCGSNTIAFVWTFLGAVLMGALGFAIGMSRTFLLRLQARVALCHKKIEENTR